MSTLKAIPAYAMIKHGVIAAGPLIVGESGCVPHAIVLRVEVDLSGVVEKYVVHELVVRETGEIDFNQGNYFETFHEGGEPEARRLAMAKFLERVGKYF